MQLDGKQKDELLKKISTHWKGSRKCNVCTHDQWSISDRVVELREFNQGGLVLGGNQSIVPIIPVHCANCGNTYFFNALALGAISQNTSSQGQLHG